MECSAENLAEPRRSGRCLAEVRDAEELFLPAPLVAQRYHRDVITLARWRRDARMRFPTPHYFGRFRYWKLSDLVSWERERAIARSA